MTKQDSRISPLDSEAQQNSEIQNDQIQGVNNQEHNLPNNELIKPTPFDQRSNVTVGIKRDRFDKFDLLIKTLILVAVIGYGFLFALTQYRTQQIENDRHLEAALKTYIDDISILMLEEKLLSSRPGDEIRAIARTKTFNALRVLDADRKGLLIGFIHDSGLISGQLGIFFDSNGDKYLDYIDIIDLEGADLRGANLSGSKLAEANLRRTDLRGANLSGADLTNAILREADLTDVDLNGADLRWADLSGSSLVRANLGATGLTSTYWDDVFQENLSPGYPYPVDPYPVGLENVVTDLFAANLSETDLTDALVFYEQLKVAYLLTDAIMPDGRKNDGRFVTGHEGSVHGGAYPIPYP